MGETVVRFPTETPFFKALQRNAMECEDESEANLEESWREREVKVVERVWVAAAMAAIAELAAMRGT